MSGQKANAQKSTIYCAGVNDHMKQQLGDILHMPIRTLPVKYLDVPLISSRLKTDECQEIVEKITKKITHWTAKQLHMRGDCN